MDAGTQANTQVGHDLGGNGQMNQGVPIPGVESSHPAWGEMPDSLILRGLRNIALWLSVYGASQGEGILVPQRIENSIVRRWYILAVLGIGLCISAFILGGTFLFDYLFSQLNVSAGKAEFVVALLIWFGVGLALYSVVRDRLLRAAYPSDSDEVELIERELEHEEQEWLDP